MELSDLLTILKIPRKNINTILALLFFFVIFRGFLNIFITSESIKQIISNFIPHDSLFNMLPALDFVALVSAAVFIQVLMSFKELKGVFEDLNDVRHPIVPLKNDLDSDLNLSYYDVVWIKRSIMLGQSFTIYGPLCPKCKLSLETEIDILRNSWYCQKCKKYFKRPNKKNDDYLKDFISDMILSKTR